jgi:hypothetical protein
MQRTTCTNRPRSRSNQFKAENAPKSRARRRKRRLLEEHTRIPPASGGSKRSPELAILSADSQEVLYIRKCTMEENKRCTTPSDTQQGRKKELIRQAHNESGHRGRDPTYQKIAEFYFWPNMLAEVALHCRTCRQCQLRSSYHPKVMINPTWVPTVLRKFNMDLVEMGISSGGYEYIVDIRDDLTGWLEARMLAKKRLQNFCGKMLYAGLAAFRRSQQTMAQSFRKLSAYSPSVMASQLSGSRHTTRQPTG